MNDNEHEATGAKESRSVPMIQNFRGAVLRLQFKFLGLLQQLANGSLGGWNAIDLLALAISTGGVGTDSVDNGFIGLDSNQQ